ncbi:MAG: beta strand repeat-containing protein [Thermodesulfobacteriota bacterium]
MVLWSAQSPAQTVYSVTTTADSGAGSLRQAVDDLNASGAAGVISFVSGSSGTIDLASGLTLTQEASLLNNSGGAVAVSLSGASSVTALTAASLGTIGGASALAIEAEATSGSIAHGIYAGGALAIGSMAATGSITATAATGNVFGVYANGGNIGIAGAMAGDIAATAISGSSAYGVYCVYGLISIGSMASTGSITATAGTSNASGIRANGVTITGEMAGGITATSGSNAIGIQAASGSISIGSMASTGNITATAGTSGSAGMSATASVGITGVMAGDISATSMSGATAYGILSGSSTTIGSMAATGSITATAGADTAYGLRASGDVTIAGVMAGTISATAGGHTALGIWSGGTLTVGSASAPLSGTVSARANGLAVAVASDGAMNLYVTGTLSGTDTSGSGNGYAIRAGSPDGSGGWTTGSADNTVTLGTGATLVGKVDLGTGTNTLALVGTGSAANLFVGVDTLVAGDGATATSWTLNPTTANASTYGAATVNPLASLTVNENVTVTGDIANGGTLVFDIGAGKTYGGIISGTGGVTKTGDAALVLSGATTYTGTTLAAGGQLRLTRTLNSRSVGILAGATLELDQDYTAQDYALVNGTLIVPELTVARGATLYGSGTIQGDVTDNGTISPGNSPGTLTILGNLILNSGSLLAMEITPSANDLLLVSGSTAIHGGTLSVAVSQGLYTSGDTFTLLSSTGGITGYFDAVSVDCSSPFLRFTIDADADSIQATVSRQSYTMAGTSRNSTAAAAGLTGATSLATPSMQVLLGTIDFMEIADVARGLWQMSPEPYSALDETAFSAMGLFSDTIRDRAYARRSGGETLLTAVSAGNIGRLTQLASAAGASDAGSGLSIKGTGTGAWPCSSSPWASTRALTTGITGPGSSPGSTGSWPAATRA